MRKSFNEKTVTQNNNLMIKLLDESHMMKQLEGEKII
jgi:hypothetical protein